MDEYIKIDDEENILFLDKQIQGEAKSKMDEKWSEFLYTYNLLLLYFLYLRNQVKNLRYQVNGMKGNPFYEEGVKPFRDNMRKYLKGEWDRAKSGK